MEQHVELSHTSERSLGTGLDTWTVGTAMVEPCDFWEAAGIYLMYLYISHLFYSIGGFMICLWSTWQLGMLFHPWRHCFRSWVDFPTTRHVRWMVGLPSPCSTCRFSGRRPYPSARRVRGRTWPQRLFLRWSDVIGLQKIRMMSQPYLYGYSRCFIKWRKTPSCMYNQL